MPAFGPTFLHSAIFLLPFHIDTHGINEPAKGGTTGKMKTAIRQLQVRENLTRPTSRNRHVFSCSRNPSEPICSNLFQPNRPGIHTTPIRVGRLWISAGAHENFHSQNHHYFRRNKQLSHRIPPNPTIKKFLHRPPNSQTPELINSLPPNECQLVPAAAGHPTINYRPSTRARPRVLSSLPFQTKIPEAHSFQ